MLLRWTSNAFLVDRLTKQHAVQQARARSSDEASPRSFKILFHATRLPQVPARISPIPPDRFNPPTSPQTMVDSVVEAADAGRMKSNAPFSITMHPSGRLGALSRRRFSSIAFGVRTTDDSSDSRFLYFGIVSKNRASASITNGRWYSDWARLMICAVASWTRGHRPRPGPSTNTCILFIIPQTSSTMPSTSSLVSGPCGSSPETSALPSRRRRTSSNSAALYTGATISSGE
mmetsp:Transcript_24006/g.56657  ORF Transcript_24006/g.56657 Transcript_24006/m.56657 type:complete len:232 (-) Transcript_24006:493-1188(-)